jgi:tetratricopeptide (TPR) repeat protein
MEASTPPTVGIPKASTPPTVGIPKASTPPPQQQAVAEKVPAAKANAAAAKSKEGHALNEMADFAGARDAFDEAYRMCPRDGEFAKQSAICLFSAGNMALKANDILGAKARYDELLGLASLDGALRAKVLEKAAAVVEATAAAAKAAPASALRSAVPAPVRAPAGIPARAPVPAPAAAAAPSPGGELSGSENTWLRGAVNELVTGMGLREDRRSRMVAGSAEAALEVAAGAFAKAGKGAALTKTERALIDMGFDREKVVAAAAAADGDFQKAVNILFLEKASSTPRPSPNRGTQSSA